MRVVAMGFYLMRQLDGAPVPATWLQALTERQQRIENARKGRAARLAKQMRARREEVAR